MPYVINRIIKKINYLRLPTNPVPTKKLILDHIQQSSP